MMASVLAIGGACIALLVLGFSMGFSPTLYTVLLHVLTRAKNAASMVRWVLAGLVVGATLLGLIFRVADPETLVHALQGEVEAVLIRRGVDLIAGAILVIAGALLLRRSFRPAKPRRPPQDEELHAGRMFTVGLSNAVIGVSGPVTMYLTARLLGSISRDPLIQIAGYAVFVVGMIGPYLLVTWAWFRYPAFAHATTVAFNWLSGRDFRRLGAIVTLLLGAGFLALGLFAHLGQ